MATVESTSLALNPLCTTGSPMGGQLDGFSATVSSLTVSTSYGSTVIVQTYQRQ
jgi:hypothetical protein